MKVSRLNDTLAKKIASLVIDSSDVLSQNLYFCTHNHRRWTLVLEEYRFLKYFMATVIVHNVAASHEKVSSDEILDQLHRYLKYPEYISQETQNEDGIDMMEYEPRLMSFGRAYKKNRNLQDVWNIFLVEAKLDQLDYVDQEKILEIIEKQKSV